MQFFKLFHLYADHRVRVERRRRVASLLLGVGIGLVVAAVVAAFIYWIYYGNRFRP